MIVVCDPLCTGVSHEKVNSGFLYGLRRAFPEQEIKFFAEKSHIMSIKKILEHDDKSVDPISFNSFGLADYSSHFGVFFCIIKFSLMLSMLKKIGINKVFFLSFTPELLFAIKQLKKIKKFNAFKFTFVLHGGFESIAGQTSRNEGIELQVTQLPTTLGGIINKFRRVSLKSLSMHLKKNILRVIKKQSHGENQVYNLRRVMELDNSSDFRYVMLSPHIFLNSSKYFDLNKFNFHVVTLPTNFRLPKDRPENQYPKFAVFGYGDSLVLYNLAFLLNGKNISKKYEIRIIGMDNRGVEGFERVTCPSGGGRILSRDEMERQSEDIDMFLILYDKTRYRLSCSGSILESLSMVKPIIHFDNDCINQFNTADAPIGFRCETLNQYTDRLADIIENYDSYLDQFDQFRLNILACREKYSIDQSVSAIRDSFTWQGC